MGKSGYSDGVPVDLDVPQVYYKVYRGEPLELFTFVIKLVTLVMNNALISFTLTLLLRSATLTTVTKCRDCLVAMVTMVTMVTKN